MIWGLVNLEVTTRIRLHNPPKIYDISELRQWRFLDMTGSLAGRSWRRGESWICSLIFCYWRLCLARITASGSVCSQHWSSPLASDVVGETLAHFVTIAPAPSWTLEMYVCFVHHKQKSSLNLALDAKGLKGWNGWELTFTEWPDMSN